jgi:DNA gyrase inhibitor GyrI
VRCRYDAGVDAGDRKVLAGKPLHRTVAGGRYAALVFRGTVNDSSARFDADTGVFECELCVPVAPL